MRTHILVAIIALFAQTGVPQQSPATGEFRGTIRGVVRILGETGNSSGIDLYVIQLGADRRFEARTIAGGRFEFPDLPAGRYQAHVEREGLLSRNGTLLIVSPAITIGWDSPVGDTVITALKGGILSGKVTDESGRPVVGKRITPLLIDYRDGRVVLTPKSPTASGRVFNPGTTTTDDRGEYRFAWMGPGEFYLRVGEDLPGGIAAGFRGQRGTPPVSSLAWATYYPAATDVRSASKVVLKPGQELSGLDIRVPSNRGVTVSGKVVSATPIGAAVAARGGRRVDTLYLLRKDELTDEDYPPARVNIVGTVSGDETQFQFVGVLPGVYELFPAINGPSTGPGSPRISYAGRTTFEVRDTNIDGITATIGPNQTIKGRLVLRDAPATFRWDGIQVRLRDINLPAPLYDSSMFGNSAADGTFTLPSVIEAQYKVLVAGLRDDTYVADVRWGASSIYDNPKIDIGPGSENQLEITLRQDSGSARGIVRDNRGEPAAGANVVLIPQGLRRENPNLYKRAISAADGSFMVRGIAPGEYRAFAWESLPGAAPEEVAGFVSRDETQGRALSVRPRTAAAGIQVPLISREIP